MASQTTYYGRLLMPEIGGGRVALASGSHKFTSSATVCTLAVPHKTVAYVALGYRTGPAKRGSKALWTSGAVSGGAIKVQRTTGSSSGVSFWYKVLGW